MILLGFDNNKRSNNDSIIVNKKQIKEHFQIKPSVFDRLGTTSNNTNGISGTKITISNLNKNVTSSDLAELCGSVGEVKQVEMKHDHRGISLVSIIIKIIFYLIIKSNNFKFRVLQKFFMLVVLMLQMLLKNFMVILLINF